MRHQRIQQRALIMVALLAAGSALSGGIAVLLGAIELPLEWLEESVFSDYTVPAVVLAVIVGGSQLIAAAALIRREARGLEAAFAAGVIMIGWIIAEILIVGSEPGLMATL